MTHRDERNVRRCIKLLISPIILQRLMLQRWLDIQRRLPGSAGGYISGTPHTTSDNASPTQLKGHVSYIVDTREWT
jgi:hypothetical protein